MNFKARHFLSTAYAILTAQYSVLCYCVIPYPQILIAEVRVLVVPSRLERGPHARALHCIASHCVCAQEFEKPSPTNRLLLPLLLCGLLGRLVARAHVFAPAELKYMIVFAQKLLALYALCCVRLLFCIRPLWFNSMCLRSRGFLGAVNSTLCLRVCVCVVCSVLKSPEMQSLELPAGALPPPLEFANECLPMLARGVPTPPPQSLGILTSGLISLTSLERMNSVLYCTCVLFGPCSAARVRRADARAAGGGRRAAAGPRSRARPAALSRGAQSTHAERRLLRARRRSALLSYCTLLLTRFSQVIARFFKCIVLKIIFLTNYLVNI